MHVVVEVASSGGRVVYGSGNHINNKLELESPTQTTLTGWGLWPAGRTAVHATAKEGRAGAAMMN